MEAQIPEWKLLTVLGYPEHAVTATGKLFNLKTEREIQGGDHSGYIRVGLSRPGQKTKLMFLHVIVAVVYLGECPVEGYTVDHINRIRTDNRVENLRWASPSEQRGNQTRSTKHRAARPITQMTLDGVEIMTWFKTNDAAESLGLDPCNFNSGALNGAIRGGFLWKFCVELMDGEEFKLIEDQEFEPVCISNRGRYFIPRSEKIGYGNTTPAGYKNVSLRKKDESRKAYKMHKLVALAFLGPDDRKVNHKDGNKRNNRITNLEYATDAENSRHAVATGLRVYVKNSTKVSKPVDQLDLNGVFIARFPSAREACRVLKISAGNLSMACKGNRPNAGGFKWRYSVT